MSADELLKSRLYDLCLDHLQSRLDMLRSAIRHAQESANEEGKSSAGDKHETSRSMAQLEQEKLSVQLMEAEKLIQVLDMIPRGKISTVITAGSLVLTDRGNYFVSVSTGKLIVDGETYIAISSLSPLGRVLIQLGQERAFNFNGLQYSIKKIC